MHRLHAPCWLVLALFISVSSLGQEHAWVYHTSYEHYEYAPILTAALEFGDILSFGYSNADSLFWLIRTDDGGNLTGVQELEVPASAGYFTAAACVRMPGGEITLLATSVPWPNPFPNDVLVFRLSPELQLLWAKRLTFPEGQYGRVLHGELQATTNGALLLLVDQLDSYCLTELSTSGDVNWSRRYVNTAYGGYSADLPMFRANDEALYIARNVFGSPNYGVSLTKLNLNGSIQWSRSYHFGTYPSANALDLTSNGDVLIGGRVVADGSARPFVLNVDQSGAWQWRMEYWNPQAAIYQCEQVFSLPDQSMLVRSRFHLLHIGPTGTLLSNKNTYTSSDFRLHTVIAAGTALTQRLIGVLHYSSLGWSPGTRLLDVVVEHADLSACGMSAGAFIDVQCSVDSVLEASLIAMTESVTTMTEASSMESLTAARQQLCDFANGIPPVDSAMSEEVLLMFPMPVSNEIYFIAPHGIVGGLLTLRDATGRIALQQRILPDRNLIDVSALAKGVYLCEATTRNARYTGRLVKE